MGLSLRPSLWQPPVRTSYHTVLVGAILTYFNHCISDTAT